MKKKELLTVKELAAELRMSLKSIQRAYRKGEIPVQWLGRMARFNLAQVQRAMERNGRSRMLRLNGKASRQGAIGGASRRRAQHHRPRSVKRGLVSQRKRRTVHG
jgi:excisionase family DNA binding protein